MRLHRKYFYLWEGGIIGKGIVEKIPEAHQDLDKNIDLKILKFKFHSLIDSVTKFLEIQCENNWRDSFLNVLRVIENDGDLKEIARRVVSVYGGMGSFNDLVLSRDGKMLINENDILESLKHSIYETCTEIISA